MIKYSTKYIKGEANRHSKSEGELRHYQHQWEWWIVERGDVRQWYEEERAVTGRLEGYRDEWEVKEIQIMPGDMTIKSSLLGKILEKFASLMMNKPLDSMMMMIGRRRPRLQCLHLDIYWFCWYMLLLRCVGVGFGIVKWGYEILERLGRWK